MCDSFVLVAMPSELLDAITIETGPNPDASVIWMHGLGDDGKGWSEVVPALGLPPTLSIRFIFPHAPVMAVTINNGMRMRAWYDIRQANLSERADLDGVRASQAHVEALIAREQSRGIASRRIILAGFSQGVAMAYRAAAASARPVSGVISLGGDVPPELDRSALAQIPAALIGRGSRDDWYTPQMLETDAARLREAGVAVTVVTLDAGHEWTAAFSEAAANFLSRVRR